MSKTWYPMINYEKCVECGVCVEHCTHDVYNEGKAPRPVVTNPDNCVEDCTGCGSLCPTEAIEYFGDKGNKKSEGCGCNTGCGDDENSDNSCEPKVVSTFGCDEEKSSNKSCDEKAEPSSDCETGCGCGE